VAESRQQVTFELRDNGETGIDFAGSGTGRAFRRWTGATP
jgi:hypothetical protein